MAQAGRWKGRGSMRILLLANSFPWLKTNGLHLRLRSVLEALARVGDLDVFA